MTEHSDNHRNRDDELLSAFLDDELGAAERSALERRLAAEPALARRLAALRRADQALGRAYGPVADEPLPKALLDLLADGEAGDEPKVVPLRRRGRPRFTLPASIAAGIALAVGIGLGLKLALDDGEWQADTALRANALLEADGELFGVFETAASGESVALTDRVSATPRLSFRTAGGGYCRELGLETGAGFTALVGCRETGGWRLEAVVRTETPAGVPDDGAFVPASGPADALDEIVADLMTGAPLGADAERAAIDAGWQSTAATE